MAKKFRGVQIVKDIKEANNLGLARFLILTQGKLSKRAPVSTGRFASSWFIGMNQPNREEEPVHDGRYVRILKDYTVSEITTDKDWFISSNLPYSERVCFDPVYGKNGAGGSAWFSTIANNLGRDAEKSIKSFLKKVK